MGVARLHDLPKSVAARCSHRLPVRQGALAAVLSDPHITSTEVSSSRIASGEGVIQDPTVTKRQGAVASTEGSPSAQRAAPHDTRELYARAPDFRLAASLAIRARSLTIAVDISCLTSRAFIGSSQWEQTIFSDVT